MTKLLVVLCAAVGAYLLLQAYLPAAWQTGFTVSGYFVSAGLVVVGAIVYFAWKGK